jgi:hypothetical protein
MLPENVLTVFLRAGSYRPCGCPGLSLLRAQPARPPRVTPRQRYQERAGPASAVVVFARQPEDDHDHDGQGHDARRDEEQ